MTTGHVYAADLNREYDDTKKKVTMGDPDGPKAYVASLGQEVPTYIDPREDLIGPDVKKGTFKRLTYHVPFKLRGIYKPEWLPHEYGEHMGEAGEIRTNLSGHVMCSAESKATGGPCGNLAVNRANVCRNHGGALHPADRKMSVENFTPAPEGRVEALTRVQKFLQGYLKVEDLTDEEIVGAYVIQEDGRPHSSKKMGVKFQQQMVRELHARMNQYMQMKLPTMLKRVAEIATSDLVEPETSFKAAVWMAERQMGKTPDVLITAQTGAPYEAIFESLESGSREDYRKSVASQRGESTPLEITARAPGVYSEDGEPLDVFEVDDGESDPDYEGFLPGHEGDVPGGERSGREDSVETGPTHDDIGSFEAAQSLETKAARAKEIIAARKKAQRRRFAARATGATTVTDMWWLPKFKRQKVMRNGKMVEEGWVCTLVCPDDQNERSLAKIEESNKEA